MNEVLTKGLTNIIVEWIAKECLNEASEAIRNYNFLEWFDVEMEVLDSLCLKHLKERNEN